MKTTWYFLPSHVYITGDRLFRSSGVCTAQSLFLKEETENDKIQLAWPSSRWAVASKHALAAGSTVSWTLSRHEFWQANASSTNFSSNWTTALFKPISYGSVIVARSDASSKSIGSGLVSIGLARSRRVGRPLGQQWAGWRRGRGRSTWPAATQ